MIYAIGNSHAHFFTDSHPGELKWGKKRNEYFTSYSGNFHNPEYRHVLAHKFTERFLPYFIDPINSLSLSQTDYIMFIVGEIDCRWHFPKKIKTQNRTPNEVLQKCIDEYFFPAFLYLKDNGYNVVGWGGHPSTTHEHNDDPDNPIYGDCLFRNEISLLWNDLLYTKCKEHNIKFVSIIRELINLDGFTKMEYFYDDYHLNPNAMPLVIKECQKEGIIKC
jgi:hypothetical protein